MKSMIPLLGTGLFLITLSLASGAVLDLPSWDEEERARLAEEGWVAGELLLTDRPLVVEEEATQAPVEELEQPQEGELAGAEQDEKHIPEEYLGAYFAEKPEQFLVDPQNLLAPKDFNDRLSFLNYHASDSAIDLYVYVFGGDQIIPSDVRAEEMVERLYTSGKPAMIVYYYLGSPQSSAIYLSPEITDVVSAAEQRRALQSSVVQSLGNVDEVNQMEAFLVQMSIRIYWMQRMMAGTAEAGMDEMGADAFPSAEPLPESRQKLELQPWMRQVIVVVSMFSGMALLGFVGWSWWHDRARYVFPEFEVEPRLGGDFAAGVGAVISFSSAGVPPARQRDQVPDYMRRM